MRSPGRWWVPTVGKGGASPMHHHAMTSSWRANTMSSDYMIPPSPLVSGSQPSPPSPRLSYESQGLLVLWISPPSIPVCSYCSRVCRSVPLFAPAPQRAPGHCCVRPSPSTLLPRVKSPPTKLIIGDLIVRNVSLSEEGPHTVIFCHCRSGHYGQFFGHHKICRYQ